MKMTCHFIRLIVVDLFLRSVEIFATAPPYEAVHAIHDVNVDKVSRRIDVAVGVDFGGGVYEVLASCDVLRPRPSSVVGYFCLFP